MSDAQEALERLLYDNFDKITLHAQGTPKVFFDTAGMAQALIAEGYERELPETHPESVRIHEDAWGDTHEGYTSARLYVIKCLWCDFRAEATLHKHAKAQYDGHVHRIQKEGLRLFNEEQGKGL